MFLTIKWYWNFYFGLVLINRKTKIAKKIRKTEGEEAYETYIYDLAGEWAGKRIADSKCDITVYGLENIPKDEPVVFIGNHQSNFDSALMFYYLHKKRPGFIVKKELDGKPILSKWMKMVNCLFIDRKDVKKSMKTILEAIDRIKKGRSMLIFPEGTRSKGKEMNEFKSGSFKLATKTKVPIVPFTINGTYQIMEANHNFIKPNKKVELYIHKPIETKNLTREEEVELPEKVKAIIKEKITI